MKRLAGIALGLFLLATCGGASSDDGASTLSGPGADRLKAAVIAYSDAFLGGHGAAAYAMLSRRCQAANDPGEYRSLVRGSHVLYGDETIKTLTVDAISPRSATVTYLYGNRNIDERHQHWAVEDGSWRWDAC